MGISIAVNPKSTGVKATRAPSPRPKQGSTEFNAKSRQKHPFDAMAFLGSPNPAKRVVRYRAKKTIFTQGERATNVMYIQEGGVDLTVVNELGNEAVIAVLGPGDFFGVQCLEGQPKRAWTAATIKPSTILMIDKSEMIRLLHAERDLRDLFIRDILSRNLRAEEDLIDQFFNSSEKRLARRLLLLARYAEQDNLEKVVPKISQAVLAEMVGTTRSQINRFLNKFKKQGLIEYGGSLRGIKIKNSLVSLVLPD
jgi:CRP/FNR family transcriptional regulator, cyclic AMP receptor protein